MKKNRYYFEKKMIGLNLSKVGIKKCIYIKEMAKQLSKPLKNRQNFTLNGRICKTDIIKINKVFLEL